MHDLTRELEKCDIGSFTKDRSGNLDSAMATYVVSLNAASDEMEFWLFARTSYIDIVVGLPGPSVLIWSLVNLLFLKVASASNKNLPITNRRN